MKHKLNQKLYQKLTAAVCALALLLSLSPTAYAAGPFTDVPSDFWAVDDIKACADLGIVNGYEDGSFKPNDSVTCIQFMAMIIRTFYNEYLPELEADAASTGGKWYSPYIYIDNHKVLGLTGYVSVGINGVMNRYDMSAMIYRVLFREGKLPDEATTMRTLTSITDGNSIPVRYSIFVVACYATGIITGMDDGSFQGDNLMTRAEACVVIQRMIQLIKG